MAEERRDGVEKTVGGGESQGGRYRGDKNDAPGKDQTTHVLTENKPVRDKE